MKNQVFCLRQGAAGVEKMRANWPRLNQKQPEVSLQAVFD
jgi:hypothetical protein